MIALAASWPFFCGITESLRNLFLHVEMQNISRSSGRIMQIGADAQSRKS